MTENRSRVLVTGAGGFIGTALCRHLNNAGRELVTLTRTHSRAVAQNAFATSDFSGDIRDRALLARALEGVNTVFHLAGIAHVDMPDGNLLQSVNVEGAVAVAKAAAEAGVHKLVFFSSSLATAAEQDSANVTGYGRSKYQAEMALWQVAGSSSLQVTVLRPVNVYGPGMKGNLATMIELVRGRRLPPLPRLSTRLSLVGLQDLCSAALLAAGHDVANGKTYLVTDGQEYHLNEIEVAIYRTLGRPEPRWRSPRVLFQLGAWGAGLLNRLRSRPGGLSLRTYHNLVTDNLYSNRQICDDLGFTPRQTFYTALPALIDVK